MLPSVALLCITAFAPARADAQSVVEESIHESVTDTYRYWTEIDALDWIDANETVARIGGWRAYAREDDGPRAPDPVSAYLRSSVHDEAADPFEGLTAALGTGPTRRPVAVRHAWIDAVAARQRLSFVTKLHESAGATSDVAHRMGAVGNIGRLDRARAQLRYADATVLLASTRFAVRSTRERLARLLGLDRTRLRALAVPDRLPGVPVTPLRPEAIDDRFRAVESRPSVIDERSRRSSLRESYLAYRTSHDIATLYRDEILPLRAAISEEHAYQYGGMLIGVFDLLAGSRDSIRAVLRAIEATRQFWRADVALRARSSGAPVEVDLSTIAADEDERRHAH